MPQNQGLKVSRDIPKPERLNSRLEWQGAEVLVLAHLLIEGIEAYKSYVNHPDYDLVAINPATSKIARISVKSRWATNRAGQFSLNSLDCDFVVHVALNRGERRRKMMIRESVEPAEIYVLPVATCAQVRSVSNKINLRNIASPDIQVFQNNWQPIQDFLRT